MTPDEIDGIDVTPEGSFAPVFVVEEPERVYDDVPDLQAMAEAQAAAAESGMLKLIGLGLTPEEAAALVGKPLPPA